MAPQTAAQQTERRSGIASVTPDVPAMTKTQRIIMALPASLTLAVCPRR